MKYTENPLYQRLMKAFCNPARGTLNKRIQNKAKELHLTTDEAIFVVASEQGMSYQRELRKLSDESRNRIMMAQKTSPNTTGTKKIKKNQKVSVKIVLETQYGPFNDPFLPQIITKEAKMMAEGIYPVLYLFENSIRNFINIVMTKNFGKEWWKTAMNSRQLTRISTEVSKRKTAEDRLAWHGKRGAHEIYYTDFDDLKNIITSNENIFTPYFKNQKNIMWLTQKLDESYPSRNISSHHNPISKADKDRVHGYCNDWLLQLNYIYKNFTF